MDYKSDYPSDDDFDYSNGYADKFNNADGQSRISNPHGLSKAELRKTNKPIMEKRRRARINNCLNELKSLILEAMKKDPARHTKLEKADILEMTVKHLQSVQRQQLNMAIQTDPSVIHKFKTGFVECAEEVSRYMNQLEGIDNVVRQRLSNHLTNYATSLEQIGSMTNFNNGYRGQIGHSATTTGLFTAAGLPNPLAATTTAGALNATSMLFPPLPQDLNNNSNHQTLPTTAPIQMGGVQLIPSRLATGEFALVMPNSASSATSLLNNNNNNNNNSSPFASWVHGTSATAVAPTIANASVGNAILSNDFAANFKRMTAFSKQPIQEPLQPIMQSAKLNTANNTHKPATVSINNHLEQTPAGQHMHQNTTATTSPPLSPVSSVSSQGDDSNMHTSSDFAHSRPATPPQDNNTSQSQSQQQQQHSFSGVFSTPSSAESSTLSLSTPSASSSTLSVHLQQQQVSSTSGSGSDTSIVLAKSSLKRSLQYNADSSDSASDEPVAKKTKNDLELVEVEKQKELKERGNEKLRAGSSMEERDNMWRPW